MNEWDRLNGNKINLEKILNYRQDLNDFRSKTILDNNNLYYNKFIAIAASFVKELSLPNNSISLSIILGRLIQLGVFSCNNNFSSENINDDSFSNIGKQIIVGNGVCRHFTYFQKDILNNLKVFNQTYTCHRKKGGLKGDAEHCVNVIEYNSKCYIYDLFNAGLFYFIDSNVAKNYSNDRCYYYKPEFLMWYEELNKEDIIERLNLYKESSINIIDKQDYLDINTESVRKIIQNIKLVSEFKEDTKDIKEKILRK